MNDFGRGLNSKLSWMAICLTRNVLVMKYTMHIVVRWCYGMWYNAMPCNAMHVAWRAVMYCEVMMTCDVSYVMAVNVTMTTLRVKRHNYVVALYWFTGANGQWRIKAIQGLGWVFYRAPIQLPSALPTPFLWVGDLGLGCHWFKNRYACIGAFFTAVQSSN